MITMTDIAEKAGVSRATVSLILNDRATTLRISETTRHKVLAVAQENGFRRNELLHSAFSGKNRMLGFLVSQSRKEAVARMLEGALIEAEAQNYTIKVLHLPKGVLKQTVLNRCIELRLAGVMALYLGEDDLERLHKELTTYRIPLACLDSSRAQFWGARVSSDDGQAFGLAVEHLVKLGHRRIAFLSGVPNTPMSDQREAAFRAAMKNHGLEATAIAYGHLTGEGSEAAVAALLGAQNKPTALIGITDASTMAALRGARALGLSLPRDLSVVGYGGMSLAEFADPALTTVVQPFQDIGQAAVRRLLARVHSEAGSFDDSLHEEFLPASLVVRASTAPPA